MDWPIVPVRESKSFRIVKGITTSSLLEVLIDSKFVISDTAFRIKDTEAAWILWVLDL